MTRRWLAWLLGVLVALPIAFGSATFAQEGELVPVEVSLNGENQGTHIVILQPDGSVLFPSRAWREMELLPVPAAAQHEGEDYLDLAALAPSLGTSLDLQELKLQLEADPAMFPSREYTVRGRKPETIEPRSDPSAYLNYGARAGLDDDQQYRTRAVPLEIAMRAGDPLLFSSFQYSHAEAQSKGQKDSDDAVRLLSNLTWDFPSVRNRLVAGDFDAASGTLGGSGLFGGLSFGTEYSLDPYFVHDPDSTLRGVARTASEVSVYMNGIRVDTIDVKPGEFTVDDIPIMYGSGVYTMTIRDAFGREESFSVPFYGTQALLKPGLHEFGYNAGFEREELGLESNEYDSEPAFLAFHRYGFMDWLTAGVRGETRDPVRNGGAQVGLRLWRLGELGLDYARSEDEEAEGEAVRAAYSYANDWFGAALAGTRQSRDYATLTTGAADDKARISWVASAGLSLGVLGTISLSRQFADRWEEGDVRRTFALYSVNLANLVNVAVSASRTASENDDGDTERVDAVMLTLNMHWGGGQSAGASRMKEEDRFTDTARYDRAVPSGPGWGVQAEASRDSEQDEDEGRNGRIYLQANGDHGSYSLNQMRNRGQNSSELFAGGSVAVIGGGLYLSRPIDDAFALARTGVPGVGILANGQEQGRTGDGGELLVPRLTAHMGNSIKLEENDLPVNYGIERLESHVAPDFRGGAVVDFKVTELQAIQGMLMLVRDGQREPAVHTGIRVTGDGVEVESITGRDGVLYFENLPPGRYDVYAYKDKMTCGGTMEVPASEEPLVDLGEVDCAMR